MYVYNDVRLVWNLFEKKSTNLDSNTQKSLIKVKK